MKHSTLFRFVITFAFVCLITASAAAQEIGSGISGYTSIDYDEETNTVMAYSETNLNYDLMGDYRGEVWLTVTKNSGVYVANGSMLDNGDGYAGIVLQFAGEPGETYTAVGNHRARLQMWDYVDTFPYERYYYDNWYFTSFEAQNIYQPWYYYFGSPGNYIYRRSSDIVSVGRTYDSVSTTILANDINFRTVSNDVNSNVGTFSDNDGITTQTATVNLSGASHPVCGANRTSFNITVNFDLPPGATSIFHPDARSYVTDSPKQQFQFLSFNFDGTSYSNGKGKMNINVRQARPTATDNSFRIHIEGGLQAGSSYKGNARVRFTCQ